ncbi:hypothetical protein UlMin_019366 [Ulmus minor]
MASSLQDLLSQEGFQRGRLQNRERKSGPDSEQTVPLPLYICHGGNHDRKSFGSSRKRDENTLMRNGSSVFRSKRAESKSSTSEIPRSDEAAAVVDEVAVKAVVSILSGYVGRFIKDEIFRESVREKCRSCLVRRKKDWDNGTLANLELGMESIEKLVEEQGARKEMRMKTVRNSIQLLGVVSSLNSKKTKNGSTCGIPNSHLSACAQLYLAIVYKLEKNSRTSARHLLQVFVDSPFLARTHLLPDLWEHLFLPHLLHLKVWYTGELECLTNMGYSEEKKMKALSKVYNGQMDMGTVEFALYYKKWLKIGIQSLVVPVIPLPERPYRSSRRSSETSSSLSSNNTNLYRTVFGSTLERRSMDYLNDRRGALIDSPSFDEEEYKNSSSAHGHGSRRRSSSQLQRNQKTEICKETQKTDYFRLFTCKSTAPINGVSKNNSIRKEESTNLSSNLRTSIAAICSSDSLSECEVAIRVISKAWLESHTDHLTEAALSKAPVIEGMLEVLFASNDDEVLELVISILSELVASNKLNSLIILNFDPQLEIFMRVLRNNSLFLKAAVLLYQLKPKAKQMISVEWVPLVLRVVVFGDQLQTLFTVQCSPQVAAFYLLDQLLTGFDEDKNLDNARQVVSLGGLSLLVTRIEIGDYTERNNAALFVLCCVRADGSCRNYLAENLNMESLIELIVQGCRGNCGGSPFSLLIELLCLNRRTQINTILNGLKEGWSGLNTTHIFLVHLKKASPEERPLVAAMVLQLDLLGDPSECSIYREEAVEAIIAALDYQICEEKEKVQEQAARALLILGGQFSYTGEASIEHWLLQQAGFNEFSTNLYPRHENKADEEAAETWLKKAATALFKSGKKRFLAALSDSMANGIPSLARASLITVSWMCVFLRSAGDENSQALACSILVPQLLESLNYDKDVETRVLASLSLLNLTNCSAESECVTWVSSLDNDELLSNLEQLSSVTWTANELISIITRDFRHHYPQVEHFPS